MITNKIKTMFLSAQPCVVAALLSFFCSDPSITFLCDDYSNFDDIKKCKRSYVEGHHIPQVGPKGFPTPKLYLAF